MKLRIKGNCIRLRLSQSDLDGFECLHKRPEDEDAFPHPQADQHPVE